MKYIFMRREWLYPKNHLLSSRFVLAIELSALSVDHFVGQGIGHEIL